jgi:hypothetical protein
MNLMLDPNTVEHLNRTVIVSGFCMIDPDTDATSERGTNASFHKPRIRNAEPSMVTYLSGKQIKQATKMATTDNTGNTTQACGAALFASVKLVKPTRKDAMIITGSRNAGKTSLNSVVAFDDSSIRTGQ